MNYITNFFRAGCVALLAVLILAPGAFAQQITTADPPNDLEATVGDATDAAAAQEGRITLTWSPVDPANNGGSPILGGADGYIIEVTADPANEASWTVVPDGEVTVRVPAPDANPARPKFDAVHALPTGDGVTTHNQTRHYRVKTENGVGIGDPSSVVMETTHDVPPAPTGLAAVAGDPTEANQQHERITVTWEQVPAADTDLPITTGDDGYILEWALASDAANDAWTDLTTETAPTGDATTYSRVHTVAEAGATRYYRVRAVSAAGASANSAVMMGTTHDVPGKPTGVDVVAMLVDHDDDTATERVPRARVSWTAPASDLDIASYTLEISEDAGATWTSSSSPITGITEATYDHAATAGNTYYYRVSAVSVAGAGETSDPPHSGIKFTVPGAPRMLTATAVDQQESIDLFWEAPMSDGEPDVTGYRIERSDDYNPASPGDATWETTTPLEDFQTGRSFRDRGLTAGSRYAYRVMAINVVGTSAVDDAPVAHAVSSNKALAPRNLAATIADDRRSIVLTWDGPISDGDNPADGGSDITGYQIEVDDGGGWEVVPYVDPDDTEMEEKNEHPVNGLITNVPGSEFTYTHTSVESGTTYIYRVSAVNDAGAGAVSASSASVSIDAALPGMPLNLTATAAAATSITLEWEAPTSNGGAEITSYEIEVSTDAGTNWDDLDIPVTDPVAPATMYSATDTGLDLGATYHYRVSATNSVGTGDPSDVAHATVADVPGAPTGLTATADGESAINLSWTAPAATGGSDVTGYQIEWSPDGTDGSWANLEEDTEKYGCDLCSHWFESRNHALLPGQCHQQCWQYGSSL